MTVGLCTLLVLTLITATPCRANDLHGLPAIPTSVKIVASPSQPDTLLVGLNQKLDQNLRWDEKEGTLTACVTYSLIDGGGDTDCDPLDYRTFELPFPAVRLDQDNNLTVLDSKKRKILLGHLESDPYGSRVVLNDNVRLIAHRKNGRLWGRIVVVDKSIPTEKTWDELDKTLTKPSYK